MTDSQPAPEITLQDALETVKQLIIREQPEKAEVLLKRILEQVPEQPDALTWLAILYSHVDRLEEALDLVDRALVVAPGYPGIHVNRGNILIDLGREEDAAVAYLQAIKLDSHQVDAMNNLGVLMQANDQLDDAIKILRLAVQARPDFGRGHYNLSRALGTAGFYPEAIHHARKAVEFMPRGSMSLHLLASAYERDNDREAAIGVVKEWLRETPDDAEVLHILASLEGFDAPDRASDAYVVSLFDRFARSFDAKLASLGYQAPTLIAKLIAELGIGQGGGLRILDGGCGTGLCGPLMKHYASRLVGIDLSLGMLQRAERTGAYDRLVKQELTAFLLAAEEVSDLIVSADTLCYFGALEEVTKGAARSLVAGGWLIFTVEAADEDGPPYLLDVSARYKHTAGYLRRVLDDAGFDVKRLDTDTLRKQLGEPVKGHIVAARKR